MNYLSPILRNNRTFLLAYDHGLEHGPEDFLLEKSAEPEFILELAEKGNFSGVIFQKGIAEKYYRPWQNVVPLIVKLNGKTKWQAGEPYSPLICSPEYAKDLGAVAVGYTIYPGSKFEHLMFKEFGQVVEKAHNLGMAVIAWLYPRGKKIDNENNPQVVCYAARIGLELGADMIKIKWPLERKYFEKAVNLAKPVKVVLAGGERISEEEFFKRTEEVIASGGCGLAVGRNIWQRKNALEIAKKLAKIIYQR